MIMTAGTADDRTICFVRFIAVHFIVGLECSTTTTTTPKKCLFIKINNNKLTEFTTHINLKVMSLGDDFFPDWESIPTMAVRTKLMKL